MAEHTDSMIDHISAEEVAEGHESWYPKHIAEVCPDENMLCPHGTVMLRVRCTDPLCHWEGWGVR